MRRPTLTPAPAEASAAGARLRAALELGTDPNLAKLSRRRDALGKDAATVFLARHGEAIARAARASLNGRHARGSGLADADLLQLAAEEALRALRRCDPTLGAPLAYVCACVRGMKSGVRSAVRREASQRRGQRALVAATVLPRRQGATPDGTAPMRRGSGFVGRHAPVLPREWREAALEAERSFGFGSLAGSLALLIAEEVDDPGAYHRGWGALAFEHGAYAVRAADAAARDRIRTALAA